MYSFQDGWSCKNSWQFAVPSVPSRWSAISANLNWELGTGNCELKNLAILPKFSYYRKLNQPINFKKLNTKEFIHALAEKLNVSHKEAAELLQQTTLVFRETVFEEKKLTIQHLGSFQMKKTNSRTAFIPALNKKALVPPHSNIAFHPAETFKDKLKNTTHL